MEKYEKNNIQIQTLKNSYMSNQLIGKISNISIV